MNQPTILIVDDQPTALHVLEHLLAGEGYRVIALADNRLAHEHARRERPDVILLDVMMPDVDGFAICRQLRADPLTATVPILFVTALDDRDSRMKGLEAGADEFLTKPVNAAELRVRLRTLTRLDRYRRLYEEAKRFAGIFHQAPEGILLAETDGRILQANPAAQRLLRIAAGDEADLFTLLGAAAEPLRPAGAGAAVALPGQIECTLPGDPARPTLVEITPALVPGEGRQQWLLHLRDVTEKRLLEQQLLQSQRIELIGQLSGGVVHDVNNLLSAISGSVSLLKDDPGAPDVPGHLANVEQAVVRASALLRQLLHFARGADGPLEFSDPEAIAREVAELIRPTFGRKYPVTLTCGPDNRAIRADATQLHQILMNLCVNARDAMPDGGAIELAVGFRQFRAEDVAGQPGARAGDFMVFSVRDHGTGIPPEIRARLFEPFFTTKPRGQGTGLGLATVQRLMQRHDGFILLDSTPGRGSCFQCAIPALA